MGTRCHEYNEDQAFEKHVKENMQVCVCDWDQNLQVTVGLSWLREISARLCVCFIHWPYSSQLCLQYCLLARSCIVITNAPPLLLALLVT